MKLIGVLSLALACPAVAQARDRMPELVPGVDGGDWLRAEGEPGPGEELGEVLVRRVAALDAQLGGQVLVEREQLGRDGHRGLGLGVELGPEGRKGGVEGELHRTMVAAPCTLAQGGRGR